MAELSVAPDAIAMLDDDDLCLVEGRKWQLQSVGNRHYAVTRDQIEGRRVVTYLHRLIAGERNGRVGFINGDGLDCRRENLTVSGRILPPAPHQRGSVGEAYVIADLSRHGHDVFVPISGHTLADLVSIRPDGVAIRWQVKVRTLRPGTSSIAIKLFSAHPRKGWTSRHKYDLTKIDGFAIFVPDVDSIYYVPTSAVDGEASSFSLCVSPLQPRETTASRFLDPNAIGTFCGTVQI